MNDSGWSVMGVAAVAGAMTLAGQSLATVQATTLFGDSYIVTEGGNTYAVLDVYIKGSSSADIISSTFGVSTYTSAFTLNNGKSFVQSNGNGTNSSWLPAAGTTYWDSFVTTGNRSQASAATTLNMQLDTNWGAGNGSSINGVYGGPGWYPAVGASTSTNPYARVGFYSGSGADNTAKATTTIAGNGIAAGASLTNHWMIGRFAIDITNDAAIDNKLTLKFAIAGKQNGSITFTGATSVAGRFQSTLTFASRICLLPACPADLDGNRVVDPADVSLLLLDFGPCSGCASDLDGNGTVDTADLSLQLLDFGACDPCPCPAWMCQG